MNKRLAEILLRRRRLRFEIEIQRQDVAEIAQGLQRPIALLDSALSAWRTVKQHPTLVAGLVATALAFRRNGLFGLAHTGGRLLLLYPSAIFLALKMFSSSSKRHASDQEIRINQ